MKKTLTTFTALVMVLSLFFASSCARQPEKARSFGIIKSYFKKYAKKYPDSIIGQHPVENVDILHTEEIHKNLVAVYSIIGLDGGTLLQTRFTLLKKPVFGWRAVSWENMGIATTRPAKGGQP